MRDIFLGVNKTTFSEASLSDTIEQQNLGTHRHGFFRVTLEKHQLQDGRGRARSFGRPPFFRRRKR